MKFAAFVCAFILFTVPSIAGAQLTTCDGPNCNWCSVVELVNNLITWLIAFLSVVAVIMLVIAGFRLVTSQGNEQAWSSAKSMFKNVILGIILVLAAWLIIDTVMLTLTGQGINGWLPDNCGRAPDGTTE